MPTLHDLLADSVDGLAHHLGDAEALPATRRLIARRRRRNVAVAGGTSALAVSGLVAGGIVQDLRADDAPAASADDSTFAFATVPAVTEDVPSWILGNDLGIGCGDTVPKSSASLEGFALEITVLTGSDDRVSDAGGTDAGGDAVSLDEGTSVLSSLTYEGAPHSPAYIAVGDGVIAQDGVVVATVKQSATRASLRFDPLLNGSYWSDTANLGRVDLCGLSPNATPDDVVWLDPGDYDYYAIAQASVTEEMIGLNVLAGYGYGPAPVEGAWAPGSIDCTSQLRYRELDAETGAPTAAIPLVCEPDAVPGATINASAGTISVPYLAGDYTDDVDVTLVSDPVRVRLDQESRYAGIGGWAGEEVLPSFTDTSELTCGAATPWWGAPTDLSLRALARDGFESLTAPGGAPIQLDESVDPSAATVSLTSPTDAWVLAFEPSGPGTVVVGRATASFSPSRNIAIDRYAGYPDVSLELTDLTWCGEPASRVERVIITGDASVTGANGRTSQGTMWSVEFD